MYYAVARTALLSHPIIFSVLIDICGQRVSAVDHWKDGKERNVNMIILVKVRCALVPSYESTYFVAVDGGPSVEIR